MRTFSPQFAALPPEQQGVWTHLAPLSALGFVLYGGTAIALRLGHRPSVDFDFFTDQPLDQGVLVQHVSLLSAAQTIQLVPNTWTVQLGMRARAANTCVTDAQQACRQWLAGGAGAGLAIAMG
jgi:hypothetical protein